MSDNPFSNFEVRIPTRYSDQLKKFCVTSSSNQSRELSPFERQVDFWYFAFLIAVKKGLQPEHFDLKDTTNITPATILSRDPYRITYIQAVFLSITNDINSMTEDKRVFDFASELAYAGIPHLIQILDDSDDKPLWNILEQIEELL